MAASRSPKYADRSTMIRRLKAAVAGPVTAPNASVSLVVPKTTPANTNVVPIRIRVARCLAVICMMTHLRVWAGFLDWIMVLR